MVYYNTYDEYMKIKDEPDELQSIQQWINFFYEINKNFHGQRELFIQIRNIRNTIKNKMDSYLKQYRNKLIMDEFYKALQKAKTDAICDNKLNTYKQYFNEIRVIQEFKGIDDIITDKLCEQLYTKWKEAA